MRRLVYTDVELQEGILAKRKLDLYIKDVCWGLDEVGKMKNAVTSEASELIELVVCDVKILRALSGKIKSGLVPKGIVNGVYQRVGSISKAFNVLADIVGLPIFKYDVPWAEVRRNFRMSVLELNDWVISVKKITRDQTFAMLYSMKFNSSVGCRGVRERLQCINTYIADSLGVSKVVAKELYVQFGDVRLAKDKINAMANKCLVVNKGVNARMVEKNRVEVLKALDSF